MGSLAVWRIISSISITVEQLPAGESQLHIHRSGFSSFPAPFMADKVKQILSKPIQLADQVIKASDEASSFKQECSELKSHTSKLADLLRQAARSSFDLYERPTARIISDTDRVLEKALSLALKCRSANGFLKCAFTLIPVAAFRKIISLLDNSIGDVSWLLRVSAPASDSADGVDYLGLPPIAANEPILCLIWEQIATKKIRSSRYVSCIVEEGDRRENKEDGF